MAQDVVDPQEGYGPTVSKSITEEDVRVSTHFKNLLGEGKELSDKDKAGLELALIARFEQSRDPLLYLESAGSINISTSELRVMAARSLVRLFTDVQSLPLSQKSDAEQVKKDQVEASKQAKEDEKNKDEDDNDSSSPVTSALTPAETRTTDPSANLEHLKAALGKGDDSGQAKAPGKEVSGEPAPPREENKTTATGSVNKGSADDKNASESATDKHNANVPNAGHREDTSKK